MPKDTAIFPRQCHLELAAREQAPYATYCTISTSLTCTGVVGLNQKEGCQTKAGRALVRFRLRRSPTQRWHSQMPLDHAAFTPEGTGFGLIAA
jgi:hypothetical protein